MKAIGKYIFRQLVITTLIVTVSLTVIVSLFGSLRLIDFILNRGLPISVLFELIMYRVPGFLTTILPIAIVAAVLSVYNRLLNDSELVIMRASGFSQWSIAAPGIILALFTMAISFPLHLYLTPLMYSNFKAKQYIYPVSYTHLTLPTICSV